MSPEKQKQWRAWIRGELQYLGEGMARVARDYARPNMWTQLCAGDTFVVGTYRDDSIEYRVRIDPPARFVRNITPAIGLAILWMEGHPMPRPPEYWMDVVLGGSDLERSVTEITAREVIQRGEFVLADGRTARSGQVLANQARAMQDALIASVGATGGRDGR